MINIDKCLVSANCANSLIVGYSEADIN